MQEQYIQIGEAAGKIYKVLEQGGQKTLVAAQKAAGVSDAQLFNQALGWLAREGKVEFLDAKGKKTEIALSTANQCCC